MATTYPEHVQNSFKEYISLPEPGLMPAELLKTKLQPYS